MLETKLKRQAESVRSPEKLFWSDPAPGMRACGIDCASPGIFSTSFATHSFQALFCLKGGFEIHLTEGRRIRVQKGEILLFSNVPAVDSGGFSAECFQGAAVFSDILSVADKRRSLCGLMLDTEQVATLMTSHKGYLYVGNNSWSRAVFAMLTKLPVKKWGPYCAFKTIELLYLLCCGALPLQETPGEYFDGYQLNIIRQIHAFIRTHLEEDLRIEKLAEQFHVSQTMLKKCFSQLYGTSLHRYVSACRVEHAEELLSSTALTVAEIAVLVGYESISQFGAMFKRRYGLSPANYRRQKNV